MEINYPVRQLKLELRIKEFGSPEKWGNPERDVALFRPDTEQQKLAYERGWDLLWE